MKMRKMASWIISLMLVFTMIPAQSAAVYAEDGGDSPAISVGAGNIKKGNKVYMGVWYADDNLYPISWIVLGAANSTDLMSGDTPVNAENARLLLTEKVLSDGPFFPAGDSNVWQGSEAQRWCTEIFYNNTEGNGDQEHFSGLEKASMLCTSKEDGEYKEWGASSLDNEQVFFLSAEEISDDDGYFKSLENISGYENLDINERRRAFRYDGDMPSNWWLRSPSSTSFEMAARVMEDGFVGACHVSDPTNCARPAFNINLNSVLFTSAAEGGKSSGAAGAGALIAIPDNNTNEWKMTLYDSGRDGFEAAATDDAVLSQDQGYTSWSIPVTYSGATSGEKEYVSAILCDGSGTAIYYGNIAAVTDSNSTSGTVDVAIPAGLYTGSYKLHIFNEQVNEDKSSDYASSFRTIDLQVKSYPPGGETPQTPISIDGAEVVLSESSFTYTGKVQKPMIKTIGGMELIEGTDYTTKWSDPSSKNAGTYTVTITGTGGYEGETNASYTIKKAANPMKVKAKTAKPATVKYSKLKKKSQTLAASKVITVTKKGKGDLSYKKVKGNKKITIDKKTGVVTVKKGLKKGTYKVQVKVKAAGNTNYKASDWKTVTFKVQVK